jgi:alpha/beta hydrolase fold
MDDFALPVTRYALSGDVSIAYQVMGNGPIDLVMVPGLVSHVEFAHEVPGYTAFLRRLSAFARVIIFDKRGQGLSDRISDAPSLEQRMDDVRAVMDAVGSKRAAVMGFSEGCVMSALFAATYPERVLQLIPFWRFCRGQDVDGRLGGKSCATHEALGHRQHDQYSLAQPGEESGCRGAGCKVRTFVRESRRNQGNHATKCSN